jgi:excisionase family DNA binding protein
MRPLTRYPTRIKGFLTTAEAGAVLGINASRVRQLLLAGELRGEKLGNDWVLEERAVRRFAKIPRRRGRRWPEK